MGEEVGDLERFSGESMMSEGFRRTVLNEICCGRAEQEVDFRQVT